MAEESTSEFASNGDKMDFSVSTAQKSKNMHTCTIIKVTILKLNSLIFQCGNVSKIYTANDKQ